MRNSIKTDDICCNMDSKGSESKAFTQLDYNLDSAVDMAMSIMEEEGMFKDKDSRFIEYSRSDFKIHFQYVLEALQAGSPSLFADYVDWNRVFFRGIGLEYVVEPTFRIIREVLVRMGLGIDVDNILAPGMASLTDSFDDVVVGFEGMPYAELADSYCRALLRGEREKAWELLSDALDGGMGVLDLYLHVFQPSLRNVGLLWQTGRISVAKEHLFTSSTQNLMARLYPHIFIKPPSKAKVMAACVSGELHEMGIRMIADILELEGYDTTYLGANTPSDAIVSMLKESGTKILLLSATMTYHIERLQALINLVRSDGETGDVKILVGGRPFLIDDNLWQRIGADGCSLDMKEAIALVGSMEEV